MGAATVTGKGQITIPAAVPNIHHLAIQAEDSSAWTPLGTLRL